MNFSFRLQSSLVNQQISCFVKNVSFIRICAHTTDGYEMSGYSLVGFILLFNLNYLVNSEKGN